MLSALIIIFGSGLLMLGGLFILQQLDKDGIDGANNPWIVLLFAIIGLLFFIIVC